MDRSAVCCWKWYESLPPTPAKDSVSVMADVAERTRRMIGHIPSGKHREYIKMQSETLTFYALERLLHVYQGCLRVKKDADEVIEILVDYQIVRAE